MVIVYVFCLQLLWFCIFINYEKISLYLLSSCVQLAALQLSVEGLEKERDFYFGKLRDIEVHCQEEGNADLAPVRKILDILYATEVRTV